MTSPIEHVARAAEMWRSADKNAISAKGDEKNIAGHQFFLATRALRLAIDIYVVSLAMLHVLPASNIEADKCRINSMPSSSK